MPTYSKSKPAQLRRRLEELKGELAAACPVLVKEIELVESLIEANDRGESRTYSEVKGPWEAINLCLNILGDFQVTKKQIIEAILDGGYMTAKPKSARGLVNDSLNHHLGKGTLALKGEHVGRPAPKSHKST